MISGVAEFIKGAKGKIEERPGFRDPAQWFDGTIALELGNTALYMKIYRSQIIDIGRGHGFLGYTFLVRMDADAWQELMTGPPGGFILLQAARRVTIQGNLLEFNRLLKMVTELFDALRDAYPANQPASQPGRSRS